MSIRPSKINRYQSVLRVPEDMTAEFDTDWIVQKKGGSEFLSLRNYHLTNLQPKNVHYVLENLFNGDKLLSTL